MLIRLNSVQLTGINGIVKFSGSGPAAAVPGTDYLFPAGVSGGQTLVGDTASGGNLHLNSTSNSTKGKVFLAGDTVSVDSVGTLTFVSSADITVPTTVAYIKQYQSGNFLMGCASGKNVFINCGTPTVLTLGNSGNNGLMGFFGASAGAKPTVTGSKGANAALTSLLTGLANIGLITDSST